MHPAPSIIAFTVVSGFGYGLAFVLGIGLLDPQAIATKIAHLLALALIAGGLVSSTLHLGNPQRAWRALSQWRSSWLSREGVLSVLAFVPLTANAAACLFLDRHLPVAGLAGSLLAAATVYSTSMIYASLRAVQAWNSRLTSACYLLFALAGGLVTTTLFAAANGGQARIVAVAALLSLLAAWETKRRWFARLDTLVPISTPETATGLGGIGRVRLFERPHMTENYLTREMGFRVARKHARKLRVIAYGAGFGLPAILLLLIAVFGLSGSAGAVSAAIATIGLGFGLIAERWLFFAEAKHAVMTYYGGEA